MRIIVCVIIFLYLILKKIFICYDEFSLNSNIYDELVEELKYILKNEMIDSTRTGSTVCGISINSSDVDIGVYCTDVQLAVKLLTNNDYTVTEEFPHFYNLTRNKTYKNFNIDIKIYFDQNELHRLRNVCQINAKTVPLSERYWLIANKIWFHYTNQTSEYNRIKFAYYKKHKIIR